MQTPAILIRDLDLIKEILVTKFNIFNKNDFPLDPKLDPLLAKNPFMVRKFPFFSKGLNTYVILIKKYIYICLKVPGDDWKKVRNQISRKCFSI